MTARNWGYWAASLATLMLIPSATVISLWSFERSEQILSSISVVATVLALIAWSVKVVWKRSTLIYWCLGLVTITDVVPLAGTGGSTWSVWTVGLMMLGSMILADHMGSLSDAGTGPGFGPAEERRAGIDLVLVALNGVAFYAVALVAALLLFMSVPMLTLPGVSVWLIGVLALGAMVLLTWLVRSEPS